VRVCPHPNLPHYTVSFPSKECNVATRKDARAAVGVARDPPVGIEAEVAPLGLVGMRPEPEVKSQGVQLGGRPEGTAAAVVLGFYVACAPGRGEAWVAPWGRREAALVRPLARAHGLPQCVHVAHLHV